MTRNGTAFQLPPLALRTYGTGYGSLPTHSIPTPTAQDHIERQSTSSETLNPETNKSVSLDRWVRFWPTPTARDWTDGTAKSCANVPANGLLGRTIHLGPTPTSASPNGGAHGLDGGSGARKLIRRNVDEDIARQMCSGSLNPTWVEWLMGFPTGHTDLRPSETP
jgi:hypothetical protein